MDRAKFKRAADVGFARRHRKFQPQSEDGYVLKKESLQIDQWRGRPAVTGVLVAKNVSHIPLLVAVMVYGASTFRVTFDDLTSPLYKRYVLEDVVVTGELDLSLDRAELLRLEKNAELVVKNCSFVLRIQYDPFAIYLVKVEDNNVLLSINDDSKLMMEAFTKKSDAGDNFAQDGHWEETHNGFTDPKVRGPESVGVDISLPFARCVYGIPEHTTSFSLRDTVDIHGQSQSEPYRLYNLDVPEYELDDPLGLYGAVPLLIGRHDKTVAGIFCHNSSETFVDIKSSTSANGRKSHWYSETGLVDVFLLGGPTATDVFQQYLCLTGRPVMPQRFALGYNQCRYSYVTQEDAISVNTGFDKHGIPYDVLWLDLDHTDGRRYFTWDYSAFPDPRALLEKIASCGRKVVTIVDPHIKVDNKFPLHQLAASQNYYVKTPDGKDFQGACWAGKSSYFDYRSITAREAWASYFNPKDYPHFSNTIHIWNDMNEPSVFDGPEGSISKHMVHSGNWEHRHVHNMYGHDMVAATYQGLRAREGRPFILTRSFFAGTQRYAFVWTGDNSAEWSHLRATVRMLLSMQVCGFMGCGADVGGFFRDASAELMVRWYQVGAFQPFFRGHSNQGTKRCEPWVFGGEYTRMIREAIRARYEWLWLWYTLFAGVARGFEWGQGPVMRPLWWDLEREDEEDKEESWMIGDSLLVAPVLEEGKKEHVVILPRGIWYDLYDTKEGRMVRGKIQRACGLDRKFVFLRGGKIVPRIERMGKCSKEMVGKGVTVVVGLGEGGNAEGVLYMDDGESFDFEKGAYILTEFMFRDGCLIGRRKQGGAGFEGSQALVEKVVVFGIERKVRSVTVDDEEVGFEFDSEEGGRLSVEGLSLSLQKDWRMEFRI